MINFKDQIYDEQGNTVEEGTNLNRLRLMGIQGMQNLKTTFPDDGTISEVSADGTVTTVFNDDGSISETFLATNGQQITKTTMVQADGTITEVLS